MENSEENRFGQLLHGGECKEEVSIDKPLSFVPEGVEVTTRESDKAMYLII
jgi:hypothetical protein